VKTLDDFIQGFLLPHSQACNMRKKSPYFRTSSFSNMAVRGIDSLRSPLLGPSTGLAPSGPTQALFKNAPGVFVRADSSQARHLSNWLSPVVEPRSGVLIPPQACNMRKKPVLSYELFLEYGGEGD
jgi:hypothetical protein